MSCCGQRREAMRAAMQRTPPPDPVPWVRPELRIPIIYRGDTSIVVRGAVTGTAYLFAPTGEALLVDSGDAAPLLRSTHFWLG